MSRFIDACWGRPTDCIPVWLMRQAGRYQASYRALRARVAFFELCRTPELAAEVTVNAVTELGVDAGIIFSDILIAADAMGCPVDLTEKGPHIAAPIRTAADVERLSVPDPTASVPYLLDAVRICRAALDAQFGGAVPLIGFAGGPLTLASYMVEGGSSKHFDVLKGLLFGAPKTAHALLAKIADTVALQLRAQVEAGCQAVQLFESWGGILGPQDFREFALPYAQRIMATLADLGVPRIYFATSAASLLELMQQTEAEVIGLDFRVELGDAHRRLGSGVCLQGNLDPACLLLDEAALTRRIELLLAQAPPRYVFNLGHGVLPTTPEARARFCVDTVHRLSVRPAS